MRFSARPFWLSIALVAVAAATLLPAKTLQAADLRDHAKSLSAVPEDAAFYASWLKNREQIEVMINSNAWKKMMSIPMVQMGWMQAQTQWQYPTMDEIKEFKNWFDSEEGQDVYGLMLEMLSDEVFLYGDKSCASLIDIAMQMNSEVSRSSFQSLRDFGTENPTDSEEQMRKKFKELLEKHGDDLDVPTMIMGFRIKNQQRAVRMLDLAASRLRQATENPEVPGWVAEQMERKQVDGHELLTLTVNGSQLPWDEIEQEMSEAPEVYEALHDMMVDKQMVLSVGVVDTFIVMSMSDSSDIYKNLGEKELLVDSDKFKKLNQHADQKITQIAYASEYFMKSIASQELSFGDMRVMASGLLSMTGVDEDRMEKIDADLEELFDDMLEYMPEPGAIGGVAFMTSRGVENFTYNWGEMPSTVDGSKKLTLVDHLGADSLGWFVGRGKQSVEGYDKFVDYCQRAFGHFEAIAEQEMDVDDWDEYTAVRDQVLPMLAKLDEANRKHFMPGFADGQTALVFDASIAAKSWCNFMDPAEEDLAMPTLAMVCGVSDADAVKSGAKIYFDVIQEIAEKLHKANPDEVPPIKVPLPAASETSGGTIYSYIQLQVFGASEQIAPNAGLSESVLVMSLLPELTKKLLSGSTPAADGPIKFDQPMATASHFKFAKTIDVVVPWIDYGVQMAIEQAGEEGGAIVMGIGMFKPQVYQMLDVMKVLDSYTGVTYQEDETWVTHGELRLIDLEE